jgi:hypothetical protein
MRSTSTVYVSTHAEYDKHKEKLKQTPCPRCRVIGCLIRHGYLWGKADQGSQRPKRGWRIFCSDRDRRKGCGKTYSILLARTLRHRMVDAHRLWRLLRGVVEGLSLYAAWDKVASPFCTHTGYRLWQAFTRSQSLIRSMLWRAGRPPGTTCRDSRGELMRHLRAVFPTSVCPVADFQVRFQTGFLAMAKPRGHPSG